MIHKNLATMAASEQLEEYEGFTSQKKVNNVSHPSHSELF